MHAGLTGWFSRVAAALAIVIGLAGGGRAETLTDALIAAYKNSNLLEQNRALLRAADEDVATAVAALRPTLQTTLDINRSNLRLDELIGTLELGAQFTIYDFGRTQSAISATKETVLATREALINVEQQVLLAAVRAYVNVLLSEEIIRLRQANVRLINQELQAARDRFEVGEITRTDVSQAESRLSSAESELIEAEGNLLVAREQYRLAVGNYPGNLAPMPRSPATARNLDEARGVAQRNHPLIRQAQRQVSASDFNIERARAEMRPSLDATAAYGIDDQGDESEFAGITMSQTLYAGGQLSALFRRALAARDQARSGLLQTIAEIERNVGEAWANLIVAAAVIEASERTIVAQQAAFDGVRAEAELGLRTTLDVLDAEQDLLFARTNRVSAEATRNIAIYALLSTMGLLTVDHLQLGIPTYDPAAYYNAVKNAPATSAQGRRLDRVLQSIGRKSTD